MFRLSDKVDIFKCPKCGTTYIVNSSRYPYSSANCEKCSSKLNYNAIIKLCNINGTNKSTKGKTVNLEEKLTNN